LKNPFWQNLGAKLKTQAPKMSSLSALFVLFNPHRQWNCVG